MLEKKTKNIPALVTIIILIISVFIVFCLFLPSDYAYVVFGQMIGSLIAALLILLFKLPFIKIKTLWVQYVLSYLIFIAFSFIMSAYTNSSVLQYIIYAFAGIFVSLISFFNQNFRNKTAMDMEE